MSEIVPILRDKSKSSAYIKKRSSNPPIFLKTSTLINIKQPDKEGTHIINGHVPVKLGQGESPIRAGGRLLVIDGGLSRAYQPVTGIAGYTLIFTSHELNLVAHQPFESTAAAISAEQDIHSVQSLVKQMPRRLLIDDTDEGEDLRCRIDDLMRLITAYRKGVIKEARS